MNDEEGEELLLIGVVEMFAFDQVEGPQRHGNFAPKNLENWPRGWQYRHEWLFKITLHRHQCLRNVCLGINIG